MSGLDDLIQQSAAETIPDFSDVSGSASSFSGSHPGLDALIHASVQDLSSPDFSDVSGGATSSTDHLPEQAAPPAPAGLDPGFMHWYSSYVQNTGAALSYDQARQLYKSLSPEQRAAAKPKEESWGDRYMRENNIPTAQQNREAEADFWRNVASGAKATADFAVHAPQMLGEVITGGFLPTGVEAAPGAVEQAVPLPDVVEGTFQSSREESQRLQDRAATRAAETGQTPETAALAYAVPQTLGNLIDPAMALGGGKGAKAVEEGATWLDHLIARGAEEELGVHAADAAEPALRAVEPSAELRQRFPGATIDAREYVEDGPELRQGPQSVKLLPSPPEGIKPGDPWLQKPIQERSAQNVPNEADAALRPEERLDAGVEAPVSGSDQERLPAAGPDRVEGQEVGGGKPPEHGMVVAGIGRDGRAYYGSPGDLHISLTDKFPDQAPWKNLGAFAGPDGKLLTREEALAALREQGVPIRVSENMGESLDAGDLSDASARHRSPEDPLAPGAESPGRPGPGEPLAPGRGAEALAPGDGRVAGGTGEPLTSLKKAYSEPERAERGLSPVEREFFGTTDETMAKARDVVEADPTYPRQLAQKLIDEDRPPRPHEVAELLYDKAKILNEEKAAMDALEAARAGGDGVAEADAKEALARARQALDVNTEASRRGLSHWGEAGRLSQLVIREDYSTSRVLQRARAAAADGALPPELEKKLTDLSSRVETTSVALDEAKDQLAQMRLKKAMAAMQREVEHEGRKAARKQVKQTLEEELADLSGQLEKRAAAKQGKLFSTTNPFQGLDPESIAIIGKIAKNRLKAGVNTAEGLVDGVFQIVKSHFDGISPRDVRDAISGYGTAPKGSRAVTESQLSRLNREMRLLSKIEDAQAGKMPVRGATPRKPSPQIKALEKRLRQEMRAQGLDRNMRLDAYRARLEGRKADLERQLATGDFTPVGRPLAVEDATTRKLKVEIEGVKQKIDTEVKRLEKANRTPGEKARDLFLKWRRGTLLSSTQTIGKLLSAAETRTLVTTPIEQLIGAGWAHVPGVSRIAAMAPREGTVSLGAEARAWASAFSKETWKDAWGTGMPGWAGGRGTGKGELDILYGKKSDFPPEVLDFFGHLHAGLKTLAKRPEFERSLALRYKHAAMHGMDTSLPEVQAEIAAKAYADSMRAVLLQENALVDGFRAFQGMLRKRGATGTATATDFFLPIVKVPSNYVTEAAEYGFGPARALTRVVWKGGIEGLEEKDAEYIMRNLKKGTLGTSLLALGYYGYDKVGGYRQRNEHREEGDVQPMTIRINLFGNEVDIPHALLHAPALEMVQVGATLHRLQIAYADRGKEQGTLAGGLAGTRGLLEQVPFYGELLRTQEGLESPAGFNNYMGNLGRSIFIPPDIQRFAKIHDQEQVPGPFTGAAEQLGLKHFDPVRRYPQNFLWDQFKVGIPWAREQVSDEKNP